MTSYCVKNVVSNVNSDYFVIGRRGVVQTQNVAAYCQMNGACLDSKKMQSNILIHSITYFILSNCHGLQLHLFCT